MCQKQKKNIHKLWPSLLWPMLNIYLELPLRGWCWATFLNHHNHLAFSPKVLLSSNDESNDTFLSNESPWLMLMLLVPAPPRCPYYVGDRGQDFGKQTPGHRPCSAWVLLPEFHQAHEQEEQTPCVANNYSVLFSLDVSSSLFSVCVPAAVSRAQ